MESKLYVGNVSYQVIAAELEEAFSRAGVVKSAKVISDPNSGRSRGFAFVEMGSEEEARKAIEVLNGFSLRGRNIIVSEAKPRRQEGRPGASREGQERRPETPGSS